MSSNFLSRSFWKLLSRGNSRTPQRRCRRFRPLSEELEDRAVPAVYTVVNNLDIFPGMVTTFTGDLRYCINQANANPGSTINFNIPGAGPHIINVTPGGLPMITAPVTINGYTEPGAVPNTIPSGSTNASLQIVLDGNGTSQVGLWIQGFATTPRSHCTVEGLVIENFTTAGILTGFANYNVIEGNFIGTDYTGSAAAPNGYGIDISTKSSFNTIGGSTAAARNIISGNNDGGIFMADVTSSGNTIQGDLIGTDRTGNVALGNGAIGTNGGILFNFSSGNLVGGNTPVEENIISGNTGDGVYLAGSSSNMVEGNYIGISNAGAALGNTVNGVFINAGGSSNTIGGTSVSDRNVISGNSADGVLVVDGSSSLNVVEGNDIGTNSTGLLARPNGANGVEISAGASSNRVGGATGTAGNLISGNTADGVKIDNTSTGITTLNLVEGDTIGLNSSGTALPNGANGVEISGGASKNRIGGATPPARNLISGNKLDGVAIDSGSTLNLVAGNYIGTDSTGTLARPNTANGVEITNASNNTVGVFSTSGLPSNLISGNSADGVKIDNVSTTSLSTGNLVQHNEIGTNSTGLLAVPNGANGVEISAGSFINTVGGTTPAMDGNLISGNKGDGVHIDGTSTTSNLVEGNYIGTNRTGAAALGNTGNGVLIDNAPGNVIGGQVVGASHPGNLISGNHLAGVQVTNGGATGNLIWGNRIGTNASGTSAIANLVFGVEIDNTASSNSVGGLAPGAGNLISGNQTSGVLIAYNSPSNLVQDNKIGTDVTGTLALPNVGINEAGGVSVYSANNIIQGNIISGNTGVGIGFGSNGATMNMVEDNFIGTDATATLNLGNSGGGIVINGGTFNTIQSNYIFYNNGVGVLILDGPSFPGQPADNNVIGGLVTTTPANGNYIDFNTSFGIEIQAGNINNSYQDNLIPFPNGVYDNNGATGYGPLNFSIGAGNIPT